MKIKENLGSNLKKEIGSEMARNNVYSSGIEAVAFANEFKNAIPENESINKDKVIKKTMKPNSSGKLIKKTQIKKPIGKLTKSVSSMDENKELDEKWSQKYKDSINCNNPKGFSQKAHCQGRKKENKEATGAGSAGGFVGPMFEITKKEMQEECWKGYKQVGGKMKNGKMVPNCVKESKEDYCDSCNKTKSKCDCKKTKKVETKEATASNASGSYVTTSVWAKSTNKKDWRGKSKTQIPGGKFVQVKKKCKKFPYCNQGDIKALKIFEDEKVKKAIKNISDRHNISENVIKNILVYEYENKTTKN
jgi:hypothetical protein